MAKIVIHAGDFPKCEASTSFGMVSLPWQPGDGFSLGQSINLAKELATIASASEEEVKRVAGTIGWGVAGAALLGPVGLLAGLLMGGKGKDVTFVATFKNGKKMLGTTDVKTFTAMQAMVF